MERILIADDERDVLAMLKAFFELQGYLVYTAEDGYTVLKKIKEQPDLILLDIQMPGMDGLEVCRQIREHVSCPILFITARIEERDRVNGLRMGADDYILKPFSLEELGARVEAHLRREKRRQKKEKVNFSGRLVIHYDKREIWYEDTKISFTKTEYELIEFFSMHQGQVFSKESLYETIWGYEKEGDSTIITEHIRRIRQKIAMYEERNVIETVWGVGYKWIG